MLCEVGLSLRILRCTTGSLWNRIGNLLGERRSKRAEIATEAALTLGVLVEIVNRYDSLYHRFFSNH